MAQTGSSGMFPELFELIADYARRDRAHQEKALRLINVAYEGPPEVEGMPDVRQVVDDVLSGHDYVFPTSVLGALDPRSVDAVVRVALYEEGNREWGIDRLSKVLRGLVRRLDAEGGYQSYEEDTNVVMSGLRTVVTGVLVDELVEDLEELAEEASEDNAASEQAPPDAPTGIAEEPERTEGAAPIAERRREVMDLLAGAATPTEVAVARAAADSYLASEPSDGDVRAARDRLPDPTGD